MQSKISSFFKPPPSSISVRNASPIPDDGDDELSLWEKTTHNCVNTYQRRPPKSGDGIDKICQEKQGPVAKSISTDPCLKPEQRSFGKAINKKRSYAQFHLELGQSDFYLRTCSTCGIKYAPGEEEDEKSHKTFHRNFTHGIPFRVALNEKVVCLTCSDGGRIVMVSDCDPPALRNKVNEVVEMMEIELGTGWILHKQCKVYLFISSQRAAGCVVVEPIREAFKILSSPADVRSRNSIKELKSNSTTLQFGEITLRRETVKRVCSVNSSGVLDRNCSGAIVCEDKAVAAVCGIRAIWVTPSNRRKRIATQLLDAARRSFCMGFAIERSQLAFSPPTAAGKALASSYLGTTSFLVYKTEAVKSKWST